MLKDLLRYKVSAVNVGLVLMAILMVFLGVAYMINRSFALTFWDKGYEIKADFVDADGIANASDVRIAGTYVGQVTSIRSVPGGLAEVTMRIDQQHSPLRQGSLANLRLQTLLGTKFIEITPGPGSGKELGNGDVIPAKDTQSPVDFDQLLSTFDKPTRDALSGVIQEGGTAVNGRGEDINFLLQDLHALSVQSSPQLETFADRKTNLDKIVVSLDTVGGTLADNREHLAGIQDHLDAVLGTISANDPAFRKFIEQGDVSLGHGVTQFTGEEQNFNQTIHLLRVDLDQANPALRDIHSVDTQLNPFISIVGPIVPDLLSAVGGYNANKLNTTCGNLPCGGFYLRQPSVLVNGSKVDTEKGGAPAAAANAAAPTNKTKTLGSAPGSVPLPITVPVPAPNLLPPLLGNGSSGVGIPGLTAPLGVPQILVHSLGRPVSASWDGGAELAFLSYVLGA